MPKPSQSSMPYHISHTLNAQKTVRILTTLFILWTMSLHTSIGLKIGHHWEDYHWNFLILLHQNVHQTKMQRKSVCRPVNSRPIDSAALFSSSSALLYDWSMLYDRSTPPAPASMTVRGCETYINHGQTENLQTKKLIGKFSLRYSFK